MKFKIHTFNHIGNIVGEMLGSINVPLIFLKRYLRLTPTLMLVVAFYCVLGRLGDGPLWKEAIVDSLSKNCLDHGWMNLLYLNDFLYSRQTCLGWSWYLSTDTHLFLICLYICVLLKKKPSKGFLAAGLAIIVGFISTFITHLYYDLPPIYLQTFLNFDDWYYFGSLAHVQIHLHVSVCAVGIVTGYILATKKSRIPQHINAMGWVLTAISFLSMYCLTWKWNQGVHALPSTFVSSIYGGLHRIVWALGLGFITISCTWGQGGVVSGLLGWEGFVPFSRVTFMVYLMHYGLMFIFIAISRQSVTFNHRSLCFQYFSNVFVSFFASFVLCLIFESPFTAMEKAFSDGKLRKQIQPVNAMQRDITLRRST